MGQVQPRDRPLQDGTPPLLVVEAVKVEEENPHRPQHPQTNAKSQKQKM
jgi:hypothetical protein